MSRKVKVALVTKDPLRIAQAINAAGLGTLTSWKSAIGAKHDFGCNPRLREGQCLVVTDNENFHHLSKFGIFPEGTPYVILGDKTGTDGLTLFLEESLEKEVLSQMIRDHVTNSFFTQSASV